MIIKKRIKSKIIRKFDPTKKSFQRIMESEVITEETKQQLKRIKNMLDPIEIQNQMAFEKKTGIKKNN